MNPDRATLNYLNSFSEQIRIEGQRLHDEGAVAQIFGNHLYIQGRVDDHSWTCRTTLKLQGNDWSGESTCPPNEGGDAALYATMLERMARGAELPEAPNEVGEESLTDLIEGRLGRNLNSEEDEYINKLERRYRRFEMEQEIFDSDLVRLNPRWPVETFDALALWPTLPRNIKEFWNYLAHAFRKANLEYPEFMDEVTDFEWTEGQLRAWERAREVSQWRRTMGFADERPGSEQVINGEFLLRVGGREGRMLWKKEGADGFEVLKDIVQFETLREEYEKGALRMDAASELLWSSLLGLASAKEARGVDDEFDGGVRLDRVEDCQLLNRLFHQESLCDRIVTLDENPFRRIEAPLAWVCQDDLQGSTDLELQLQTGAGDDVTHFLWLLPGEKNLYLSDETLFSGPDCWIEGTEVQPRYVVPRETVESETGVKFLARVEASLPSSLEGRVKDERLDVTFEVGLSDQATGAASEHLLVRALARNEEGTREEVLGKDGWEVVKAQEDGETLYRYDRDVLFRALDFMEPMALTFDRTAGAFRSRVTKNFPEKYAEWLEDLPDEIKVQPDADLATLSAAPVEASVSFEVVNQEIDWFDLKVVVKVEGHDLSEEEIKELVAARGGYVRMKSGGWMRLQMQMSDEQRAAVSKIGIDPFDLSGESHRMHVLQLAEPMAQEVFDAATWDKISQRSNQLKLDVRPAVPKNLSVDLRPYQEEGFHFLAYLSANRFGGILADDMGLGKTIQALCWLLWLRDKNDGEGVMPSLVVCPKSVLDVWAAEVRKASPEIRVQVLRSRQELDMEVVKDRIDLLVINYSQLRSCSEELMEVEWLAAILDEGQQIKNPDSKAAKAARQLRASNRLVLTGTPIENRLLDIWSLMSFSMPGILGNRKYFKDRFDKSKDQDSQSRLSARLRPFLLRRTKGEVALDLPPKTEEDVFCDAESIQDQMYRDELERIQKILMGIENDESLRKNSFVILQGLMRLRQICCHPGLIEPSLKGESSAKMTALFYLLDQLKEEGHKVLVFSQFVKMLDIIKDRLDAENRPYSYLTGQTQDREQVIEKFQQSDDPEVFLLSLKAGGSGLNLTAASYVVLYDPWWNPAVEAQAIDRTHRIGQESKVIAYRLLMKDTVEEKIRILQQKKRQMMTGVLGEEGFARNLKKEDLAFLFEADSKEI
ncbi:MAG: DEAD/DEAH box helicase [Verrucomicrobia bacterium]|nr:DEAD/DEAH box helicase [Verrucomicrobiota bacterium]